MRYLMLLAVIALLPSVLSAELQFNIEYSCTARSARLFEPVPEPEPEPRFAEIRNTYNFSNWAEQPILEDGRDSADRMFGAGGALGINSAAVGIGFSGWFDFYFTPWLAAGAWMGIDYGFVGRRQHDGGSALMFNFNLGAKFVLDFADVDITDWFRPWGAFYPIGLAYFAATEEADPPGSADRRDISYSDLYYMMAAGLGIDFMLTRMIGLGFGLYFYGTIGGSRHETDDVVTRTRGYFGIHFEYIRFALRF